MSGNFSLKRPMSGGSTYSPGIVLAATRSSPASLPWKLSMAWSASRWSWSMRVACESRRRPAAVGSAPRPSRSSSRTPSSCSSVRMCSDTVGWVRNSASAALREGLELRHLDEDLELPQIHDAEYRRGTARCLRVQRLGGTTKGPEGPCARHGQAPASVAAAAAPAAAAAAPGHARSGERAAGAKHADHGQPSRHARAPARRARDRGLCGLDVSSRTPARTGCSGTRRSA